MIDPNIPLQAGKGVTMFDLGGSMAKGQEFYADMKARAAAFGRGNCTPYSSIIFCDACAISSPIPRTTSSTWAWRRCSAAMSCWPWALRSWLAYGLAGA